jgi:hypothetical protein
MPIPIPAWAGINSPMSETVAMTQGGLFITGNNSSGTHSPLVVSGKFTFNGADASGSALTNNHFSLKSLSISGGANNAVQFTGANPQRLFLSDMWLSSAGAGVAALLADNTGTGSYIEIDGLHIAQTASTGDNYCIDVTNGAVHISDMETSVNAQGQVARVSAGASLTIGGESEIDANGDEAIHVASTGSLAIAQSQVTNIAVNSSGIRLDSGAVAIIGETNFQIPLGAVALTLSGTTGSVTVTGGTGAGFKSTDVGRTFCLPSNGAAGMYAYAAITAFTSSTVVTATLVGTPSGTSIATGLWSLGYAIEGPATGLAYVYMDSVTFLPYATGAASNNRVHPNVAVLALPRLAPRSVINLEEVSPEQYGGIYGTVYRTYFGATLPAALTAGSSVSKLLHYETTFTNGISRFTATGYTIGGSPATVELQLIGTAGKNNLQLTVAGGWSVTDGWVDYTK